MTAIHTELVPLPVRLGWLAVLLLGTGCEPQYGTPEYFIAEARRDVAKKLRDPASAIFTDVRSPHKGVVCGKVNGKNAFGAMAGAEGFIHIDGMAIEEPSEKHLLDAGAHLESEEALFLPEEMKLESRDYYALVRAYGC